MRARNVTAIALAAMVIGAGLAGAQEAELWQEKRARAQAFDGQQAQERNLLPPGRSTATRTYLGVEVHQGGLYEPSIFPTETWLQIACIHADMSVPHDRTKHGSAYFKVHALVYDAALNKIHDTTDTTDSDEAICNVGFTADTSFIELPRSVGRRAAAVAFIAVPSARQYVEASRLVYRILPR